jgi:hypothetical protein
MDASLYHAPSCHDLLTKLNVEELMEAFGAE